MKKHFYPAASVLWIATGFVLFSSPWASLAPFLWIQGVAFMLVRDNPVRHWPVAAMALAQAAVLPFLLWSLSAEAALVAGAFAALALVAWPLISVLNQAYEQERSVESVIRVSAIGSLREGFEGHRTSDGTPLNILVDRSPALLVFLRHTGCTFCRQTLADLKAASAELAARGVAIVVVHQSSEQSLAMLLERYGLQNVHVVHDSNRRLYRHFGLDRGSVWQVANPVVVAKTLWSAVVERHGMREPDGDPMQMPGVFTVVQGSLVDGFYHRNSSDRPDYVALTSADRV